jgi:hypothetical protein
MICQMPVKHKFIYYIYNVSICLLYLFMYMFIYPSIHVLSIFYLRIYLCIYLSINPSIHPYIHAQKMQPNIPIMMSYHLSIFTAFLSNKIPKNPRKSKFPQISRTFIYQISQDQENKHTSLKVPMKYVV